MGDHSSTIINTPTLKIESLMSVSPLKLTDLGEIRGVIPVNSDSGALSGCFNILLYYHKSRPEDSGWFHGAWIKESLGRALSEQPVLSGRVRINGDSRNLMEIVPNDSGVRLVQARRNGVTLPEFLGSVDRKTAETELVFWKDIDGADPQFSPLFYVQVTNFNCGGYSFGISCSILLADLLLKDNFLKKWAKIHNHIMLSSSTNKSPEPPIFYLPKFKRNDSSSATIFNPSPSPKIGQTKVFNVNSEKNSDVNSLAMLCIEKAEREIIGDRCNLVLESFSLFVNEPDIVKIEKCSKLAVNYVIGNNAKLSITDDLDELGAQEVEFCEGNRPVHVSVWMNGSFCDDLVIAIPCEFGAKMIVTVLEQN